MTRLKAAVPEPAPARPAMPPAPELALDADRLRTRFVNQLEAQGGTACSVDGREGLLARLAEICRQEGVARAMAAEDDLITGLALTSWSQPGAPEIVRPSDYPNRNAYTRAVFDDVQAGITSADYAVAESGTIVIAHHARQARLLSLAPLVHIAVVPLQCIVPTYESALENIFNRQRRPSQITLITGPSMTADIQATPFKGMHGPRKLFVLLAA